MEIDDPRITVQPQLAESRMLTTPPFFTAPVEVEIRARKLRALVADDDPEVVTTLQRILTGRGYEVATARDGEEAWVLATSVDFDVLFSDLEMPRTTGLELLRSVNKLKPDLPVVLITGNPSVESAVEALNSGVVAYIEKPFDPQQVRAAADKAVALRAPKESQSAGGPGAEQQFEGALAGLLMHYQPIVRWSTQSAFSYEALLRTSFTEVPHPGVFLDLAEALGRVHELGRRVRAHTAKEVLSDPLAPDLVFINLHPAELLDHELYSPDAPLSKIAPRVFLEVTERESLRGMGDIHERMAALKDLGYRIAIDDIGAGYSGLTSFVDLEPHVVKIDMGLVRGIDTCGRRQKLVRSLVDLALDLGIEVVAEGIETPEERDALLGLRCDLFQGYLFSRPCPSFPQPRFKTDTAEAS